MDIRACTRRHRLVSPSTWTVAAATFLSISIAGAFNDGLSSDLWDTLELSPCTRLMGVAADDDVGCATGAEGSSGALLNIETTAQMQ